MALSLGEALSLVSCPADHRITIRLKPEEYAVLKAKAGNVPLAQFVREQALGAAAAKRNSPTRTPQDTDRALARILALLGSSPLVTEFRGVAKAVDNGTTPRTDAIEERLAHIDDHLATIKQHLTRALGIAER